MAKLRIIKVYRVDIAGAESYYTRKIKVARAIIRGRDKWSNGYPPTAYLTSALVIIHGKQTIAITATGGYEDNVVLLDKPPKELA